MRVFGIGLSRTGTSSLNAALLVLGFRARHFPSLTLFPAGLRIRRREFGRYDAMTDLPVALFFRELDRRFPGSKFVHTVRDVESWLESCARYRRFAPDFPASRRVLALRKQFYGTATFDRERFRAVHEAHGAAVRAWFAARPGDLLELDITRGQGFELLCPFLGMELPAAGFPHRNANPARSAAASRSGG